MDSRTGGAAADTLHAAYTQITEIEINKSAQTNKVEFRVINVGRRLQKVKTAVHIKSARQAAAAAGQSSYLRLRERPREIIVDYAIKVDAGCKRDQGG